MTVHGKGVFYHGVAPNSCERQRSILRSIIGKAFMRLIESDEECQVSPKLAKLRQSSNSPLPLPFTKTAWRLPSVGMASITEKQLGEAEKKFRKYESMIKSMTVEERESPDLLATSSSRRRRIARGSGTKEAEVAELMAAYGGMKQQMGGLSKMMKLSGGDSSFPFLRAHSILDYSENPIDETRYKWTFRVEGTLLMWPQTTISYNVHFRNGSSM